MSSMDARRNQYREELQVARDALASLRCNFRWVLPASAVRASFIKIQIDDSVTWNILIS